jgi:hypothetical protein
MAAPTPSTRTAAHIVVGLAATAAAAKAFGRRGGPAALVTGILAAFFHEKLDAPVAQAMAGLGIRL